LAAESVPLVQGVPDTPLAALTYPVVADVVESKMV
jgi:hypothetical protein